MKNGTRMAVAVGLGYLLGRTKKMRLALMIAGAGATGRLVDSPGALVKQATRILGSSQELKTLTDTVRGRLTEAGKAAAINAVSSQVDALSERIEGRAQTLSGVPTPGMPGKGGEADEADGAENGNGRRRRGKAEDEEEAPARRPRRAASSRRSRPAAETDENGDEADEGHADERPRRATRSAARSPVRRARR